MVKKDKDLEEIEHTSRLKLQNIIIGRDKEIETIKMQLDTVLEGHSALTVIAGDMGVGKTTLIRASLADLSNLNGSWVYAKFEQYKEKEPYIAIIQIIERI
ncbi:MAG: BREX system ATP-binding domain-containing protein, partial [Bacillota bacterium]